MLAVSLDSDDRLLVALNDLLLLVGLATVLLLVLGDHAEMAARPDVADVADEYLLLVLAVVAVGFQALFGVMPLDDDAPIELGAFQTDFEVLAVADLYGYVDELLPAVGAEDDDPEPCSQALLVLAAELADAVGLFGLLENISGINVAGKLFRANARTRTESRGVKLCTDERRNGQIRTIAPLIIAICMEFYLWSEHAHRETTHAYVGVWVTCSYRFVAHTRTHAEHKRVIARIHTSASVLKLCYQCNSYGFCLLSSTIRGTYIMWSIFRRAF